jgi:GDP-L-fucose synthase
MKKRLMITGADALIGSALKNEANNLNFELFPITRKEADLVSQKETEYLFKFVKPNYVINCAAQVGGVGGNLNSQGEYYYNNIMINTNVIHNSYTNKVEKMFIFGSTCAFPSKYETFSETNLHEGEPFGIHFGYAFAKRMTDIQIRAYKSQYGNLNYCSIFPGNVFGAYDNFNLKNSHVVPSLIHKTFLAKNENTSLKIWGNGTSKREFIYSKDLAKIIMNMLTSDIQLPEKILISSDEELTIKDLANKIANVFKFEGNIEWEIDKPNGQYRKRSDTTLLKSIIAKDFKFTDIDIALDETSKWFIDNYNIVRK